MNCKNCETPLRTDYSFCAKCGAKIIRNRITFKNLWYDVTERYFNVDNTFLRTFIHLFTKPEIVIDGYISGIRKKYLNPVSYLGIALTLSSFVVYLMVKASDKIDFDVFGVSGGSTEGMTKVAEVTFDFQALLFIAYIPMMAIAGWICFESKKYNFTERLVLFMYTLAHYSITSFVPSVLILLIKPLIYGNMALVFTLFMYLYSAYIIKRLTTFKGAAYIARTLIFYMVFTVQYFGTSLAIPLYLIITGQVSPDDFLPKK